MDYPLLTKRLSIRPLGMEDLDSFVSYRRDPDIARFQGWEPTYNKNQALELLESQAGLELPAAGQWLQLAIHNRVDGALVGDLALHLVSDGETVFELGFTIAREHQGNGFAKEATSALIQDLITRGATKFSATTDRRNLASIKVLTSLGFDIKPSKSWTEEFKNEIVTVDYFEKTTP